MSVLRLVIQATFLLQPHAAGHRIRKKPYFLRLAFNAWMISLYVL